jgi:hypothetical protein
MIARAIRCPGLPAPKGHAEFNQRAPILPPEAGSGRARRDA